jgi:ABC-type uncharacterized transport system involved in gliding motility auxiliary subunit
MKRILSFLESIKNLAAILCAVSLFIAILIRFFLPEITESVLGLLILSLVLFLVFVIGARIEIKDFMLSKRGRYGLNTIVMIAVFIAILICANYLGVIKHRRFDVTASSQFTLAPQTMNVIKELKAPVQAIGFFPSGSQYQAAQREIQNLLEEYRYFNRDFSYKFVDPEAKPALAKQYQVRYNGTIVFVSGSRQKTILAANEQNFTGALLEVTGIKAKKVYFLTGHGERDMNDKSEGGYFVAGRGLIRDLYQIETLNLTLTPEVPQDCAVLIMAGAKKAFPPAEKKALQAYLKRNGKILVLVDPNPPAEVREIIAEWGITIDQGRVIDKRAYAAPDMASPAIFRGNYPPYVITAGLDTTYFPDAASVILTNELSRVLVKKDTEKDADKAAEVKWPLTPVQYGNVAVLPAMLTTRSSWLERTGKKPESKDDKGAKGPLALGAMLIASAPLVEEMSSDVKREKLTRLVVIGDSDFASNAHIQNGGNGDLFLNAVNWLAEEEHLIAIRPKQYSFRRLVVSKNAERFIRYSSVGLLPVLVIILGGIIWWRKR